MTKIHRNVVSHAVSQLDTYTCTRLVNSTHIPYGSNILALILLTNEIFLPSYSLRVKYSCYRFDEATSCRRCLIDVSSANCNA